MNIDELAEKAEANFHKHLVENSYPGRGIVIGCDPEGNPVLIYWIMGRSSNSRNRLFNLKPEGGLKTEAADSSLLEDPSLIIYNAVLPSQQGFLVTNGDHTDRILAKMRNGKTFLEAMHDEKHEPDPPNFTPRIAGLMTLVSSELKIELALVCNSSFSSEISEVHYHHFTIKYNFLGSNISSEYNHIIYNTCFNLNTKNRFCDIGCHVEGLT